MNRRRQTIHCNLFFDSAVYFTFHSVDSRNLFTLRFAQFICEIPNKQEMWLYNTKPTDTALSHCMPRNYAAFNKFNFIILFFAPKRGSKRNSDRSSINKVPLLKCIFNAHIYTYIRLDERDNNYKIAFLRHYSVYILQVNCNFDCSRHTKKLSRSLPLWRCTRCCIYKYKPTKKRNKQFNTIFHLLVSHLRLQLFIILNVKTVIFGDLNESSGSRKIL